MLIRNHIINAIGAGVFMNSGFVIAVVIFTYHWGMDREFDYASSLSTIALLSYLSLFSIYFLYSAISAFSTFIAIMIRVGEILLMEEFSSPPGLNDGSLEPGTRVVAKNASVTWGFNIQKSKDKEEFKEDIEDVNLHSINLEIKDGELVTIVGAVGCGKSTMLHSLMHELKITEGSIKTNGTRAYVEQEPFIMSGTLKDNILVGSEFDAQKFEDVCKACCLDHDIDNLPHGAETEIGERGVTISGGQKARLSLARAVYSDADIFFLDDPLSAVDPDVASKLFKNCINGYLKDKCRVLVTHQVQYLKNVDSI
jgi:ATP-binding cassette subfamily C (CFTR/MRP) protein 4